MILNHKELGNFWSSDVSISYYENSIFAGSSISISIAVGELTICTQKEKTIKKPFESLS